MLGKGVYTALQQLQPIQEDFSDNIKEQEELAFRYRAEQRAIDDDKRKRAEKFAKDLGTDLSTLDDVITRVDSIDTAYAVGVNKARDVMYDVYSELRDDPTGATNVDLQLKLANLRKFSKRLGDSGKIYKDFAADFAKGYADGTYSKWNEGTMKKLSAIFDKADFTIDIDNRGNPIAVVRDEDGEYDRINLIQVLDGRGLTGVVDTVDVEAETDTIADNLGERLTRNIDGSFKVEGQTFDDHEQSVRDMVRAQLGTPDNVTDFAKSAWVDEGNYNQEVKQLDDSDLSQLEDYIVDRVRSKYDEKYLRDFDAARANVGLRRRELRRKESEGLADIEAKTTTGGELLPEYNLNIGRKEFTSFSLGSPVSLGVGDKTKKINSLYMSDDGEIVYEGAQQEGTTEQFDPLTGGVSKTPNFVTVRGGGLDEGEVNDIARRIKNPDTGLPFRNASELRGHLEAKKGEFQPNQGGADRTQELRRKYNY